MLDAFAIYTLLRSLAEHFVEHSTKVDIHTVVQQSFLKLQQLNEQVCDLATISTTELSQLVQENAVGDASVPVNAGLQQSFLLDRLRKFWWRHAASIFDRNHVADSRASILPISNAVSTSTM